MPNGNISDGLFCVFSFYECMYISLCDFVCLALLLPFGLGFYLSFFPFFFFQAVWLAGSWCSGWVSGLRL